VRGEEDVDALYEASKFRRLEQFDSVLVQRKSNCGRRLLLFSCMRNIVKMNVNPPTLRMAIENEMKDTSTRSDRRIAQNLKVFNGIKGACMLLMAWGFTHFFA
jgi:chorismate mutase